MLLRPVLLPTGQQRCVLRIHRLGHAVTWLSHHLWLLLDAKLCILLGPLLLQLRHGVLGRRCRALPAARRPGGRRPPGLLGILPVGVLLQPHVGGSKAVVICIEEEVHLRASLQLGALPDVAPVAVDPVLADLQQGLQVVAQVLQRRDPAEEALPLLHAALGAALAEHGAVGLHQPLGLALLLGLLLVAVLGRRNLPLNLWPLPSCGLGRRMPEVVLVLVGVKVLAPTLRQGVIILARLGGL
mmetsp:Transcript_10817/g.29426  ORF Transcript_10817/g.29426 Transcript_10817/m.29426 type:complete len:242 (-) Transcript_10817:522-1247(-)